MNAEGTPKGKGDFDKYKTKVADLSKICIFGNKATDGTYGFGFDSGLSG